MAGIHAIKFAEKKDGAVYEFWKKSKTKDQAALLAEMTSEI